MTQRRSSRFFGTSQAFTDSSAFLAIVGPHDVYHRPARDILTGLNRYRWHTFTTNFVVAETHALFIARLGHRWATEFLRGIRRTDTVIVRVTPEDEARAEEIIFQYHDKVFSYTDATSFAVMERLDIPYAFTFDQDFRQYGLAVLTPEFFRS